VGCVLCSKNMYVGFLACNKNMYVGCSGAGSVHALKMVF
jgi:hypothetical protein